MSQEEGGFWKGGPAPTCIGGRGVLEGGACPHLHRGQGGSGRGGLPPLLKERVPGSGRQRAGVQQPVVEPAQVERRALQALAALPQLDQQVLAVQV